MACYNCKPAPRPRCHRIRAVIDEGIVYCIDCGKDVTCELNMDKICDVLDILDKINTITEGTPKEPFYEMYNLSGEAIQILRAFSLL